MLFLNGAALRSRDERGRPVHDDSFLLLFNSHVDTVSFTLPHAEWAQEWIPVMATESGFQQDAAPIAGGTTVDRPGLSLQVLQLRTDHPGL
jgi:glycogen operon protein